MNKLSAVREMGRQTGFLLIRGECMDMVQFLAVFEAYYTRRMLEMKFDLKKKLMAAALAGYLLLSGAPAPGEAAEVTGTFDSRVYQSRQFFRIN